MRYGPRPSLRPYSPEAAAAQEVMIRVISDQLPLTAGDGGQRVQAVLQRQSGVGALHQSLRYSHLYLDHWETDAGLCFATTLRLFFVAFNSRLKWQLEWGSIATIGVVSLAHTARTSRSKGAAVAKRNDPRRRPVHVSYAVRIIAFARGRKRSYDALPFFTPQPSVQRIRYDIPCRTSEMCKEMCQRMKNARASAMLHEPVR